MIRGDDWIAGALDALLQFSRCHDEAAKNKANALSKEVIGASIEVHRELGPGLLESAYEECLCYELGLRGIASERQVPLPAEYKGLKLDCGYRIDLLVDDLIIIELKSVTKKEPVYEAQLLTYLQFKGLVVFVPLW
jgi:GxxExxY protein